jgi:hypothetical protein
MSSYYNALHAVSADTLCANLRSLAVPRLQRRTLTSYGNLGMLFASLRHLGPIATENPVRSLDEAARLQKRRSQS